MADFGPEFVRIDEDTTDVRGMSVGRLRPNDNSALVSSQNTASLLKMIEKVQATGGFLAIPAGRFYLGPAETKPDSEVQADIVINDKVMLWFVPNGQLVPISVDQPNGTRIKVKMEIQGFVDAGLFPIFDVFLEPEDDRTQYTEAGTVVFTRHGVRALYPEWWGASSPRLEPRGMTFGVVRRTTAALQACFDAAHRAVAEPPVSLAPGRPIKVGGTVVHRTGPGLQAGSVQVGH